MLNRLRFIAFLVACQLALLAVDFSGSWALVVANILAAPLIDMAPALSRRVGHHGQLVLSGIRASLEPVVVRAYRDVGMTCVNVKSRDGWVALMLRASW